MVLERISERFTQMHFSWFPHQLVKWENIFQSEYFEQTENFTQNTGKVKEFGPVFILFSQLDSDF